MIRKALAKQVEKRESGGIIGQIKVTISVEGVSEEGRFAQSKFAWQAIEKIAQTDDYLFIYNTSITAIIVPKRSFPDEAASQDFARIVREYLGQAKNQPA